MNDSAMQKRPLLTKIARTVAGNQFRIGRKKGIIAQWHAKPCTCFHSRWRCHLDIYLYGQYIYIGALVTFIVVRLRRILR